MNLVKNQSDVSEGQNSDDASADVTAGRGFLLITGAKVWFMLGGATITFGLPFVFNLINSDGRSLYGQYYDINNTLSIFSMVLIGGLLPGISRYSSNSSVSSLQLLRQGRKLALFTGLLLLGTFFILSTLYAAKRGHPQLSYAYVFGGLICLSYAFYAVHIGILNGQKRFKQQALFDVIFTTLKVGLVVGAAAVGFGVNGAFAGFSLAAICIALLSAKALRHLSDEGSKASGLYAYVGWLSLYTLAFNLAFKIDALVLRPYFSNLQASDTVVDALMGEYGIAISLSRLPWQGTIALTFIIFPMLSAATFRQDLGQTQQYIENTIRYALILICTVAVPLCARPDFIFDCLPGYELGPLTLKYSAPAYICFSIANIHNTILMSAGRARTALVLMLGTLTVVTVSFHLALSDVRNTNEVLEQAGLMTFVSFGLVSVAGAIVIRREFGTYLNVMSLVKIISVLGTVIIASRLMDPNFLWMKLFCLCAIPLVFLFGLWLVREFSEEDKQRVLRVIRGRQRANSA